MTNGLRGVHNVFTLFVKEEVIRLFHNIGATELIVIGLVLLLLFGGKKLPELSRGVGDAMREFRKAAKED